MTHWHTHSPRLTETSPAHPLMRPTPQINRTIIRRLARRATIGSAQYAAPPACVRAPQPSTQLDTCQCAGLRRLHCACWDFKSTTTRHAFNMQIAPPSLLSCLCPASVPILGLYFGARILRKDAASLAASWAAGDSAMVSLYAAAVAAEAVDVVRSRAGRAQGLQAGQPGSLGGLASPRVHCIRFPAPAIDLQPLV
jgi:hypothetical protein